MNKLFGVLAVLGMLGLLRGAGPLAWPVLAVRYGGWAAARWCLPALVLHITVFRLVMAGDAALAWLGLGMPLLYFFLAHRLASHDHPRRAACLRRRGWQSLGRSPAPMPAARRPGDSTPLSRGLEASR